MKKIKLDSILLFSFVIPFIMTVRLGPKDTPYWFFSLIFLLLLVYLVLDIARLSEKTYAMLKKSILWGIIIFVLGSAFSSAIIVRHQTHPVYQIHDMPLQQEIAIRFLLDGKNPYNTSYFGTFLEQWHYSDTEINPALYHFVLPPFYILFAIPFYFLSNHTIGYFDARIPLLFLNFFLLITGSLFVKNEDKKRSFLMFLAFNPAMLLYTLEGRSDIFMLAFFVFGLWLLQKKRYGFAGVFMALAFAIKQSVWPFFPFYASYVYFQTKNIKQTIIYFVPFAITFFAIVAPFFFWNSKAFLDSVIFYLSGATTQSYPISGYGFGMMLREFNFIKDVHAYYPFIVWQIIFGLPLLYILIKFLWSKPTIQRLLISYGIFLFVFWYLSRYFNNSHLAYLSVVFIIAYFWPDEK
ncbi:MAG: DUF2029 domain-containing protein [Candidatus Levyibacteriota bacterium]|nr:MAG: DUF2029 domain-containing protein [Candidatus Levybacteria bacterium]